MNWLSPSILAADFNRLGEQIRIVQDCGSQALHFDVMDGLFVPSISFGMPVLASIRKETDLFLDVHLMIREPVRYIREFTESGADLITVHYEACSDVAATLRAIREAGVKVGMSIRPETPVSVLRPFVKSLDLILIMSVNPGFGGQKFMEGTYAKLSEVRQMYAEVFGHAYGDDVPRLEVDGGINLQNVASVLAAGADTIVTGSAVFRGDIADNTRRFLSILAGEKE
ncbi:MAG: ribulose-phosphate 3-epimerase [Lachnospiraceae bacterium]|nr:ribulose-phosphate 3-epimerase [Lachnospiraceae bacterium]MCR5375698.1 ribulose-phosphate 3-epimerase [Lachnospiraceae bacterium]